MQHAHCVGPHSAAACQLCRQDGEVATVTLTACMADALVPSMLLQVAAGGAAVTVWMSARAEPTSQLSNNRAASDMTRSRPIASQDCERNVNCGLAAVTRLRMADANASCSRRRPPERKPPATAKK